MMAGRLPVDGRATGLDYSQKMVAFMGPFRLVTGKASEPDYTLRQWLLRRSRG